MKRKSHEWEERSKSNCATIVFAALWIVFEVACASSDGAALAVDWGEHRVLNEPVDGRGSERGALSIDTAVVGGSEQLVLWRDESGEHQAVWVDESGAVLRTAQVPIEKEDGDFVQVHAVHDPSGYTVLATCFTNGSLQPRQILSAGEGESEFSKCDSETSDTGSIIDLVATDGGVLALSLQGTSLFLGWLDTVGCALEGEIALGELQTSAEWILAGVSNLVAFGDGESAGIALARDEGVELVVASWSDDRQISLDRVELDFAPTVTRSLSLASSGNLAYVAMMHDGDSEIANLAGVRVLWREGEIFDSGERLILENVWNFGPRLAAAVDSFLIVAAQPMDFGSVYAYWFGHEAPSLTSEDRIELAATSTCPDKFLDFGEVGRLVGDPLSSTYFLTLSLYGWGEEGTDEARLILSRDEQVPLKQAPLGYNRCSVVRAFDGFGVFSPWQMPLHEPINGMRFTLIDAQTGGSLGDAASVDVELFGGNNIEWTPRIASSGPYACVAWLDTRESDEGYDLFAGVWRGDSLEAVHSQVLPVGRGPANSEGFAVAVNGFQCLVAWVAQEARCSVQDILARRIELATATLLDETPVPIGVAYKYEGGEEIHDGAVDLSVTGKDDEFWVAWVESYLDDDRSGIGPQCLYDLARLDDSAVSAEHLGQARAHESSRCRLSVARAETATLLVTTGSREGIVILKNADGDSTLDLLATVALDEDGDYLPYASDVAAATNGDRLLVAYHHTDSLAVWAVSVNSAAGSTLTRSQAIGQGNAEEKLASVLPFDEGFVVPLPKGFAYYSTALPERPSFLAFEDIAGAIPSAELEVASNGSRLTAADFVTEQGTRRLALRAIDARIVDVPGDDGPAGGEGAGCGCSALGRGVRGVLWAFVGLLGALAGLSA
ncbi:MAG: hypothetical protein MUC50_10310 [Myxococcota bacterium]|jgi:hypothetical protein|nr:hypothetical protein [Myxococcota bacterium]